MEAYLKRRTDKLFWIGIQKGDILWFIDGIIKHTSESCIHFSIALFLLAFCSIEIGCQLFMLTQKPTLWQLIVFGPMFFVSLHVLFSVGPIITKRYRYRKIYNYYMTLWSLESADKEGTLEIQQIFQKALCIVIIYSTINIIGGLGYLPLNGLDYNKTIFPAVAALNLIKDGPKIVICLIVVINYALVFAKAFYMFIFGLHMMHLCVLYNVQQVLLRRKLKNIVWFDQQISRLVLIENNKYQKWVKQEIKECIKLDIKLKKFSTFLINYFNWVLFVHVGNGIVILGLIYYMNLFLGGGSDPIGSIALLVGANLMAVMYAYCSETFHEQVDLSRNTLFETPWYTFDISNRKLVLIFLQNLARPKYLSAGIFVVNYPLLIFVMHKCFNLLTVLAQMMPEDETERHLIET